MTQKPTKGDFRGLNQNNFPGVYSPGTPLEACALEARLGNRSASILDPRQLITPHFHRFHSLTTTNILFSLFSPPTLHFHCFNATTTTKTTFLLFHPTNITFQLFSCQNYHHKHHISIVFFHYHHISIVFTPPPTPTLYFHCFYRQY